MNEQEFFNLWSKFFYGNIIVVLSQKLRVVKVLDFMRDVYKILKGNYGKGRKRQLIRLYVYIFVFQVILIIDGLFWKNIKVVVVKVLLIVIRYVCGLKEIDFKKFKLFMDDLFFKSIVLGSFRV